jgi:hypothetical protein
MVVGVGNCLLLIPFAFLMNHYDESLTNIILFIYSGVYFSLSMGAVASCLLCIDVRLSNIKKVLKMNFNISSLRSGRDVHDYVAENRILVKLNEVYRDLHFGMGETSRIFGIAGMLGIFLCFLYSIHTAFITYKSLYAHDNDTNGKAVITIFWWLFTVFYPIIIIAYCELIKHNVSFLEEKSFKSITNHDKIAGRWNCKVFKGNS